jgi:hypothetical protein
MILQGPKIAEGQFMCQHCGHTENHYYQTVELYDTKKRIYLCSKNCYNRYHRVSQQFQDQHVTPRTQNATVKLTAHISVDVTTLPTLPDADPREPREDSQPGKGMDDDNKTGAVTVLGMPNLAPPAMTCCQKLWECFCRCKCRWG